MKVLRKEPQRLAEVIDIEDVLPELQKQVGGYIQGIYPFEDLVSIVCNDDGKLLELSPNIALVDKNSIVDIIVGPLLIVGLEEDHYTSLTDTFIAKYLRLLNNPSKYCMCGKTFIPAVDITT